MRVPTLLACLLLAGCGPSAKGADSPPTSVETPSHAPPLLRPLEGMFVELAPEAWFYQAAEETALALRLPARNPRYAEPRGTYRVTAKGEGWLAVETLTADWKRCTVSTFRGMELRAFVRERDVTKTLDDGALCDRGPRETYDGVSEWIELAGLSAKVVGEYEPRGFHTSPGICESCVVQFRVTQAFERVGPKLYWPGDVLAGTTTEDFDVLATRPDPDVEGRTCFEVQDREERPAPTPAGAPAELCVASEYVEAAPLDADPQGRGRLPRYLVRELLPREALLQCLLEERHISFVVRPDGTVSAATLADSRSSWNDECVTRVIAEVPWPSGFAATRIAFYGGGASPGEPAPK